jgi:hypothetical protein
VTAEPLPAETKQESFVTSPDRFDAKGFRVSSEDETHIDYLHLRPETEQLQRHLLVSEEEPREKEVVNVSPPARVVETKVPVIEVAGEPISQPKKMTAPEGSVVSAGDAISTNDTMREAPAVETAPDSESLVGIYTPKTDGPLLVNEVISADIEAPGSEFVEQRPDDTNEAMPHAAEIAALLEADQDSASSEAVSNIVEAFALNKNDIESTSTELEPVITVIELLPEATQIAMSEYLAETGAEEATVLQEMLATMAPVLKRYETLIIDGLEESVEAEQIEAVLMEWYETLMQTIGQPIEPEKAAKFIVLLQQTIMEHQAEYLKSVKDDGTHEHKLGLPNLQTVLKLKDGLELELGRLTVRRLAAQLA